MTQRLTRAILVKRDHAEVAKLVSDPHRALSVIPGFARFAYLEDDPDEGEHWDVFLDIGTIHVGGRVLVQRPTPHRLEWESLRGTRHSFSMDVEEVGEHSQLTMTIRYSLSGLLMARISELLARGIVTRHLEAGLQELRHHLEYGDVVGLD